MFLRQKMISFYQDCQNRSSCDLFQVLALTCKFKRKRQNTILASGKNFFLGHDMHYNFFYQIENGLCRNSEVQVHHSFCLKTKFLH